MKQLAEEEKQNRFTQKRQLGSYYKQQVDTIDQQKRQQFEQKKNDTSNLEQTLQLQNEAAQKYKELIEQDHQVKSTVKQTLDHQVEEKHFQKQVEKQQELEREIASTGFQFECYVRDPIMRQETVHTGVYQKNQIDAKRN